MKLRRPIRGTRETYTTGGKVASHPEAVAVLLLVEAEHLLELVTEGEVQGLRGEVTDDVGSVAAPEGHNALIAHGALEAVADTVVLAVETTGLKHLILRDCQYCSGPDAGAGMGLAQMLLCFT